MYFLEKESASDARICSRMSERSPRAPAECGFDVPEHEVNLARSLFVLPKHAQTSLRPLAEIQARIGHRDARG